MFTFGFFRTLALLAGSAAAIGGAALPAGAENASSVRQTSGGVTLEAVTLTHFSVNNRELYAEVTGSHSAAAGVNLFAVSQFNVPIKVSPGRIGTGWFRVPMAASLNSTLVNGRLTAFVSPSEDGSQQPSARGSLAVNVELPRPEIVSAVSDRNAAEIHGKALRGASVRLELAGQQYTVTASGHSGDWQHTFRDIPEGYYAVKATVVDDTRTFPDSRTAQRQLQVVGTIIRPLAVTSPPENFPVDRRVEVRGVASPGRGNVFIQLGGGERMEAEVNPAQHSWSAKVISAESGSVPLEVSLPGTGEKFRYNVQVRPWGSPTVNRFELSARRDQREARYLIEGTATLDHEVLYEKRDGSWAHLADVDIDGSWRYEGPRLADLNLRNETIGGQRYVKGRFNVPSAGDHAVGVEASLLQVAPELTSPVAVGPYTELRGVYYTTQQTVKITLPSGDSIKVPVSADHSWSAQVGPLPLGRHAIELGPDVPVQLAPQYDTRRYVLDVQEEP